MMANRDSADHDCPRHKPDPPVRCPACDRPMRAPCYECGRSDFDCYNCGAELPGHVRFGTEETAELYNAVKEARGAILYYPEMEPDRDRRVAVIRRLLEAVGVDGEIVREMVT